MLLLRTSHFRIQIVRVFLIIFILFMLTFDLHARDIMPPDDFVDGWKLSGAQLQFTKSNLYGHINGGAELFLEFGFEELIVQTYIKNDVEITIELYRMESPEAAHGIYLMKCGNETPSNEINARNTCNRFQLMIVKSNYFVLLNNFGGDDMLFPVTTAFSNSILKSLPEDEPIDLQDYLSRENLIPGSILLFRGPYGLQPIFTFGEDDIFLQKAKIFGIVGDYVKDQEKKYTIIKILYPTTEQSQQAFKHLISNLDPYLNVIQTTETTLIFRDFQNKFGVVTLNESILGIKFRLETEPNFLPADEDVH